MIYFNIFFAGLNAFAFFINQNGNIYIRGLSLAVCIILGLGAIVEAIRKKKPSVKNISTKSSSSTIEIEKHGSYYYKETCPICGCIFNFDPHSLGFSYGNIGEENETRAEWIYCPECAHKFEWDEG
jgi:hypothetical protein